MPNCNPRDRFFNQYLTLMKDSYNLCSKNKGANQLWDQHAADLYLCFYTPGIYADGYIVFAFPFVCSLVRSFVRSWNLRQSFALKFLKWCISQQLHIRKHSYSDHSYPGGLAFTP